MNEMTVRELLALIFQFSNCDCQDASSEGENDEIHLYQGPAQPDRWQACCNSFDRSVMNIHYVTLTWDQVTFTCLVLRRSVLLITD